MIFQKKCCTVTHWTRESAQFEYKSKIWNWSRKNGWYLQLDPFSTRKYSHIINISNEFVSTNGQRELYSSLSSV